jgi:hypothetical protein
MPELILDSEHRYWRDAKRVPGVTEILDGVGLIDTRWFTDWSRVRGTAVHKAVHFHLEKDLDWKTVDERIKGYVEAAITFLDDSKFQTVMTEHRVLCVTPTAFAGTLDVAGALSGREVVADWKSGASMDVHGLQLAAYDLALGGKRRRRIGIQLRENGTYKKRDYEDRRDYDRFLAAADLFTRFIFKPTESAPAAEKEQEAHDRVAC